MSTAPAPTTSPAPLATPSSSPPSAAASAPPPAVPSSPPPAVPSSPPPAVPSSPPPAVPSSPPPAVPSSPPPAVPSLPPPAVPSSAPPATPSVPPPAVPSSPPPAVPSSPPPVATPSTPSPPPPTPNTTMPSPPSQPSPSTPAAPSTPSLSPPAPSSRSPPASGSPPSTRTPPTTSSPSPPSSSSSGVSTSLVVGIAVGAGILLLLVTVLCIVCRRKKRRPSSVEYYGGPPPAPPPRKDDVYGERPQSWQQNAPPPQDYIVKVPPQFSPPPPYANRPLVPPQPPPMFSSSGGSGSNYSGSENPLPPPSPGIAFGLSQSKSNFTYEELAMASDGFSDANLLGQGGFGYVHRGMLPTGKEVAIKQMKAGSGQGEREFQAEVEIISRVHHKHLVSLVGYCIAGDKRLLVYEYVPNNTLEFHLHGKGRPTMDWSTRLKIALGSAKGLAYLHEDCHPKIIHRDIKASNILLDYKFEAKVADFGLAKFTSDTNTHVSTRVMGTFGYLAPEYAASGKLSDKSDVFSFGVMLLELITGRRPVDSSQNFMEDSLVDWARPLLTRAIEDHNYEALVDPQLQHHYDMNEMARMVSCTAAAVRHSARRRPRMSQIVRALEGDASLDDLNEGVKPGHSSIYGSLEGSDYDDGRYRADMKRFRQVALGSQEYGSSEYSAGTTSEYGQNPSASSSEAHTREMESGKTKKDSRELE